MSFLKDIKPENKRLTILCVSISVTLIAIALITAAATTGCFDVFLDGLFGLAEAKK